MRRVDKGGAQRDYAEVTLRDMPPVNPRTGFIKWTRLWRESGHRAALALTSTRWTTR